MKVDKASFEDDGFLVIPDFVSIDAIQCVRTRAEELIEASGDMEARSVFSTRNQQSTTDDHFLGSGDKIRCFFEEEAFDDEGNLLQPLNKSINKLGHAMHDLDPVFEKFSHSNQLAGVASSLGLKDPVVLQSMYIFKQPHIGGEVTCHQDATFLYTEPMTVTGFWFALEDATIENGCLWAIPGGHRNGLKRRFVRHPDGQTSFDELNGDPWDLSKLQALEVRSGTLIVLHGLLPHMSYPNRSPRSRHAYTLHAVERSASYPAGNWLQRRSDLPLRGFV